MKPAMQIFSLVVAAIGLVAAGYPLGMILENCRANTSRGKRLSWLPLICFGP